MNFEYTKENMPTINGETKCFYPHFIRSILYFENKVFVLLSAAHELDEHHKMELKQQRKLAERLKRAFNQSCVFRENSICCFDDGETVEVETKMINGVMKIVDAWVKTR